MKTLLTVALMTLIGCASAPNNFSRTPASESHSLWGKEIFKQYYKKNELTEKLLQDKTNLAAECVMRLESTRPTKFTSEGYLISNFYSYNDRKASHCKNGTHSIQPIEFAYGKISEQVVLEKQLKKSCEDLLAVQETTKFPVIIQTSSYDKIKRSSYRDTWTGAILETDEISLYVVTFEAQFKGCVTACDDNGGDSIRCYARPIAERTSDVSGPYKTERYYMMDDKLEAPKKIK